MALGATHYHFIREIPMLHRYEVRMRYVGWDNKWLFILGRFVSHGKAKNTRRASGEEGKDSLFPDANLTFQPSVRTPVDRLETATPANTILTSHKTSSDIGAAAEAMKAIAAAQLKITEEPDGATLHCVSISQVCAKIGRITVPPGIVLALSGFSAPPSPSSSGNGIQPYSHSNPPPHYPHIKGFFSSRVTRHHYRQFLRGGWRDVPEGERWWVDALGGVVEEQRRANVEGMVGGAEGNGPMGLLRRAIEGAKDI